MQAGAARAAIRQHRDIDAMAIGGLPIDHNSADRSRIKANDTAHGVRMPCGMAGLLDRGLLCKQCRRYDGRQRRTAGEQARNKIAVCRYLGTNGTMPGAAEKGCIERRGRLPGQARCQDWVQSGKIEASPPTPG